ncbi:MAG: CHASE3 domain-containing protein [Rhodocyclaceae bacterium]
MSATLGHQLSETIGRLRLPNWHHVMLAAGGALVVSLLVSSHWQFSLSMNALAALQSHRDRIDRVDALLIDLLDAETGVRGYMVTGNESYLEPYRKALPDIGRLIPDLREDARGDADETAVVEALTAQVDRKLAVLAEAVASRKVVVASDEKVGPGKAAMDDIRHLLGRLKQVAEVDASSLITESSTAIGITRWVNFALGMGAMLLLIALFALILRQFRLRTQIAQLLQGENQRLEAEVSSRTRELSTMAWYLANASEVEKGRLARELHDEMGAILTSAKMDTSWIARKLDASTMGAIRERFDRLVTQLNSGIALKRRIIDNLRPPLLEELGLTASLQAMVDEARASSGLQFSFSGPQAEPVLSADKSLALFRIAQESLTNVRKYAQAKSVRLELSLQDGSVRLEIEDDGRGFDPALVSGTHGIAGMRFRVQMFRGRFDVHTAPGQGTRVVAEIPL